MNVGIGTEAAQFLFWEFINGIFVAVQRDEWMAKQEIWMTMMVAPPYHCKELSRLGSNRKSRNGR